MKFVAAIFTAAFIAVSVSAQTQPPAAPTLTIVTEAPNLPADLYYGNVKIKPLRLRPGTNKVITIDDADFFVQQQYIDFLGRMPDTNGFATWLNTINQCPNGGYGEKENPSCDRVHVSAGFYQSTEFQGRGYFVYRFYQVGLGRRPTYKEFAPDLQRVGGAQSPDQEVASKISYTTDFAQRAEFKALYDGLSNQAFVDKLLQTAGVTLTNQAQLVSALESGQQTRAQVLRAVAESQEVFNKYYNQAFVAMQYFGYLKRDPDTNGFSGWVQTLDSSGDYRHMIFGFIYSTEYRERF